MISHPPKLIPNYLYTNYYFDAPIFASMLKVA